MKIIGITGGIGSGKSTVSAYLSQRGYPVVDADQVARDLTFPGSPVLAELADAFGPDILDENGLLDRKALARKAFADASRKAQLDHITHGPILREIRKRLADFREQGHPLAFVDAALLIETGLSRDVDEIWLLIADPGKRAARVSGRDRLPEAQVRTRMDAQMTDELKAKSADFILENNSSIPDLLARVEERLKQHEKTQKD